MPAQGGHNTYQPIRNCENFWPVKLFTRFFCWRNKKNGVGCNQRLKRMDFYRVDPMSQLKSP